MQQPNQNPKPKKDTRFQPGQSGNPRGRAKGSRNLQTLAMEMLLDGEAENLTRKAIELALGGDVTAMRLCLDRILPPRKDRPIIFDVPELKTAADAVAATGAIIKAVAAGDVTPGEANELTKLVETFANVLRAEDLQKRIEAIEAQIGAQA